MNETGTAQVRVRNLVKEYQIGGTRGTTMRAVNDISFDIPTGSCLGLVGESGSGKTTTAMICAGLTSATSGSVEVLGTDISGSIKRSEMRKLRRRIQVVFQDPHSSLDPRMSVKQIIMEPLQVHKAGDSKERQETVEAMLRLVGLSPNMATRYPHQLSGGQAQRVSIARALALHPDVIILDEPVASLDLSIQAQILNLLNELRERLDLTYLFIGHDLAAVSYVSNAIAVMEAGDIVEMGPVETIYENPQDPYTQKLVSAVLDPFHHLGAFNDG